MRHYPAKKQTVMSNDKANQIRVVLNRKWNPIGLSLPDKDDEYEVYVRYIMQRGKWQEKELTDYLVYVEANHIGMHVDDMRKKVARSVATEIMKVIAV